MSPSNGLPRQTVFIPRSFAKLFGWRSFPLMSHLQFWKADSRPDFRWRKFRHCYRPDGRSTAGYSANPLRKCSALRASAINLRIGP